MTPELVQSMSGCEIVALDSADRIASCTLITADGAYVKLSGTAAVLATGFRDGRTLEDIAVSCSSSVGEVEQRCTALALKLQAIRRAQPRAAPRTFIAHRSMVLAPRVRVLAEPLSRLCGPRIMSVLGAGSVAIVLGALWSGPAQPMTISELWIGYLACLPILFAHELGHASACHRHGAPVGPIGVALYLIYPAFYCDVTAAWRLGRWQRLAIDLGGVYFQAIITAAIAIAWCLTGSAILRAITMLSTAAGITNLIPFFALDGYWVLSDALGVVNLREQRRTVLAGLWGRMRGRPVQQWPWPVATTAIVVVYSIAAIVFAVYVAVRLVLHGVTQLRAVPLQVVALCRSVSAGEGHAALSAVGHLMTGVLIAIIVLTLIRRAVIAGARLPGFRFRLTGKR